MHTYDPHGKINNEELDVHFRYVPMTLVEKLYSNINSVMNISNLPPLPTGSANFNRFAAAERNRKYYPQKDTLFLVWFAPRRTTRAAHATIYYGFGSSLAGMDTFLRIHRFPDHWDIEMKLNTGLLAHQHEVAKVLTDFLQDILVTPLYEEPLQATG